MRRNLLKRNFPGRRDTAHFLMLIHNWDVVYQYIFNQEEHHRKKTFKEEYIDFLEKFEIAHEERYLFDWMDDAGE